MSPYERKLEELGLKNGRMICPAHDDKAPSLSISEGEGGRVLMDCKAGCTIEDVLAGFEITAADLFPSKFKAYALEDFASDKQLPVDYLRKQGLRDHPKGGIGITYYFSDGRAPIEKRRTARAAKDGSFWPKGVSIEPYGDWSFPEGHPHPVLIVVEGESDTLTGRYYDLPVLGLPGVDSPRKTLRKAHVRGVEQIEVIQEPGPSGERFVENVRIRLRELGFTGELVAVRLPYKDLSELHCAVGARFLDELDKACEVGRPVPVQAVGTQNAPAVEVTDAPRAIARHQVALPFFDPVTLLPPALAAFVAGVSAVEGLPALFLAVTLIAALGALLGPRVAIRPRTGSTWEVVPNLWAFLVGRPGTKKSPSISRALQPLRAIEAAASAAYKARRFEIQARRNAIAQRQAAIDAALRKATDPTKLRELEAESARLSAEVPEDRPPVYITNDATVEKLAVLATTVAHGLLLFVDELAGLLRTFNRQGREGDRAFLNTAWNGNEPFRVDRIGRPTVEVPALCISLIGSIQPNALQELIREANSPTGQADGFAQRPQLMVFVDENSPPPARPAGDVAVPDLVSLFADIANGNPTDWGAVASPEGRPYFTFAPDAQAAFDRWCSEHEQDLASGDYAEAHLSHLGKYEKLLPALALIFHVVEVVNRTTPPGPIQLSSLERALALTTLLKAHASKAYAGSAFVADTLDALMGRLSTGQLAGEFTVAQVIKRGWRDLRDNASVREALVILEEHRWVTKVERPEKGRPGRPTETFVVHPGVRAIGTGR